ncbi:MAG: prolyl oligopeptidase family serine peptidase [Pirellulaceae bacterium]|nr:prolyl oligopeptidase family serine peptidase [Pirellulaceae bacterium]
MASTSVLHAQTTSVAVVPVWPSDPPAWTPPTQSERDTSGPESNQVAGKSVIRLGNVAKPELHSYPAGGDHVSDTTIVICPGGGYSILAWDLEGTEIAEWLQQIGVSSVVLKYRVPTRDEGEKWLAPVQDIQRTISLLRNGAVDGIPGKRIGVLGFSAGGNAAARSATAKKRYYEAVDESDEANYLPDFAVLIYPAWLVHENEPTKLIDEIEVTDSTPPMFFAHARDDRVTCMSSVTLFSELQKRNIAASLHVFGGGGHGFGARENSMAEDNWPMLCEAWMRERGWLDK